MRGTKVLIRAYGGEPFVGIAWEPGPKGIRVTTPQEYERSGVYGDPAAAGFSWEDVFVFDSRLAERLQRAFDAGNNPDLVDLWQQAVSLREHATKVIP